MYVQIIVAALFAYCHATFRSSGTFSCENYWWDGTYCLDDYSGYHFCKWKGDGAQYQRTYNHEIVKCPANTRCGCHYRIPCNVEKSEICVPYTVPKPMNPVAIFKYSGERKYKDEVTKLSGEIRQDKEKEKYFKTHRIKNKLYFHLLVPRVIGGGSYMNYYGNMEDKICQKWISSTSPRKFFIGKHFHRYYKSLRNTNADHVQKWYSKQGDWQRKQFDKYWFVKLDSEGEHFVPVKYTEKFLESETTTHAIYKVIHWTTVIPKSDTDTDYWFQKPDFC